LAEGLLVNASRRELSTLSLQNPTQCLRCLPGLLIADVGVAHRGADILVAEESLDFAQVLSHVVKENRSRGMA
jgi:hypothetical protein